MNYDELLERLNALVGHEIWMLLWSGGDKQSAIASLSGIFERADSDAAEAAERSLLKERMKRAGKPNGKVDEALKRHDELVDALRYRSETGEWPPDMDTTGAIAIGISNPDADRSQSFVSVVAGGQAVKLYLNEDRFMSAGYDRDGLTVKFGDTVLTFMGVYRKKHRDHQRKQG